jgi:hypothetical protein
LQIIKKIKLIILFSEQVWLEYDKETKMIDLLDKLNHEHFGLVNELDLHLLKLNRLIITHN